MLKVPTEAAMNKISLIVLQESHDPYHDVLHVSCRCIFKVKPYEMLCKFPVLAFIYLIENEIQKVKSGN